MDEVSIDFAVAPGNTRLSAGAQARPEPGGGVLVLVNVFAVFTGSVLNRMILDSVTLSLHLHLVIHDLPSD